MKNKYDSYLTQIASGCILLSVAEADEIIEEKESKINHLESIISKTNKEISLESLNELKTEKELLLFELDNVKLSEFNI